MLNKLKMNKTISLLLLLFSISLVAQRTCSTDEKLKDLIKNKPEFAAKYKEMMDFIYNPNTSKKIFTRQNNNATTVVTIPVVFHVLYKNSNQNISDAQIQSQLDVLNKDYRKLNTDFNTIVPAVFKPTAADVEILFCKATKTPNGLATNGITRKSIPNTFDFDSDYYSLSGEPAWDTSKYLNIWIGELTDPNVLGFFLPMSFGGIPSEGDGVCINYKAFGTTGTAVSPFRKGRTATHEIGHYFGLLHPWGDGGDSCGVGDGVADTPATFQNYSDCPTFPSNLYACNASTNGSMFMNFMDYVDDACMAFFTTGQKEIIRSTLSGPRLSLLSSNGCSALGLNEFEAINAITVYPNPATEYFLITSPQMEMNELEIYNVLGQLVKSQKLTQINNFIKIEDLSSGTYYIRIYNEGKFLKSDRIIKK